MAKAYKYHFWALCFVFALAGTSLIMAQPVSDFSLSAESWGTVGKCPSESSPGANWSATGGNPGGMIWEEDEASGTVYWNASGSEWKADLTSYYGCNFAYDSKTNNTCCGFSAQYQILLVRGDDHALSYQTPYVPEWDEWTTNVIPLSETGWVYEGLFNSDANCPNHTTPAATAADMLSFLADIKRIRIRAEYAGLVYETNYLDNVRITCDPIALAVQMTEFNAYDLGGGRAQLDWATQSEMENKYFQVEKSTDGLSFDSIGVVYGQGTTNDPHDYSFTDPNFTQEAYYRLKTYSFDNVVQYSHVVFLQQSSPELSTIRLDPNPANTTAQLLIGEPGLVHSWEIVDLSGKKMTGGFIHSYNGWYTTQVDVSAWNSGMYIIKIATDHGLLTSRFQVVK